MAHCRDCSALRFAGTRGCCKEVAPWERRIYGSGYEWWEGWRGKGIPLLLEQKSPVRTGKCCRTHEGSQHPSEEGSAPFSLAATQAQSVINPQNGLFFFKNRPCPPTGFLNKSLAPVLFSSRSPGSAALSLQHWYFSAERGEQRARGPRPQMCCLTLPIACCIWAKPGEFLDNSLAVSHRALSLQGLKYS